MESLYSDLGALFGVIIIDLALSADNAIAVGLAAAALPEAQRRKAVSWGIGLALILRIVFGLLTVTLLQIKGLLLIGGIALLWIAYRMGIDLRRHANAEAHAGEPGAGQAAQNGQPSFARAIVSIVVANIALSLDNVLAVAGVARETPAIMVFGLVLSIVLMGVAADFISRVIERHRWIGVLGVAVIVLAAISMIWSDGFSLWPAYVPEAPGWMG